ncbi:hypothetical protein LZ30DRAFT_599341 [Colletotrichum cereale]|nr:hypothetical protein LZ30DRAFT_599341 [Colletotrichum cereale]
MSILQKLPAILALAASVIILLSSILCLVFKMTAFTSYMDGTHWGTSVTILQSPGYKPHGWIRLYPLHLMPVIRAPLVVAGSFGLVIGLAMTWLIASSFRRKHARQLSFVQQTTLVTILCANALLATISMIYVLVQHGRSAHFDAEYLPPTAWYDNGQFSLEAWACETPRYVKELGKYSLGEQCVGERGSRILVVVLCFFSLAVPGLLVWDLNTAQVVVAKKAPKRKDSWEDEGWEY